MKLDLNETGFGLKSAGVASIDTTGQIVNQVANDFGMNSCNNRHSTTSVYPTYREAANLLECVC